MAADSVAEAPELAVVMPIFNEEINLPTVIREWFECLGRSGARFVFFAINDGSTDDTANVLAELAKDLGPRLRPVTKFNAGHGRSCREGYQLALAEGARWVFQIDSDGQCDPVFFPKLYAARAERDCIFAYRQTRDDGWGRAAVSGCCRLLLGLAAGVFLRDPNVPYRLISAGALRAALRMIPPDVDLQNIALSIALGRDLTLRWTHVPIHFRARRAGKNSMNYGKIVKMGITLLHDVGRIGCCEPNRWQRPAWVGNSAGL